MRPVGRTSEPMTELEIKVAEEYLNTNKSRKEVCQEFGVSNENRVSYLVKKYFKERGIEKNG